ncbi:MULTISPECIES: patatin-like phospholipase family protein [Aerococcus]|uniref:patatin-like phospholipase family protein n=1 Tax=Aerococcus TaxID=1375 RepID=UPI000DCD980F|nr:patatin family protein [Aerococcus urinae]MDK7303536.1 patatin family protein [Aerococcus urinae]RAV71601.1 patatin family protein [Aerococcus urinae]RAW05284.1 patatin family protein [Aerococcus urinae]
MTIGLVLEGGGMRALFSAGVLDVFLDEGIQADQIVGVSAGALYGVNFPSQQSGRALRYNKKYIKDKRYISLSNWVKTGNIVSTDFAYQEVPFELDPFDEETYEESPTDFYAVITNVETGQAEYPLIENAGEQIDVLRASGSMPFVSKMVPIKGKKYLDGGLADSIPYRFMQSLGVDRLIIVLTQPYGYRKEDKKNFLAKAVYGKNYPQLVETIEQRTSMYNQEVSGVEALAKKNQAFVLQPAHPLEVKRLERDPERLQATYDHGVEVAKYQIDSLKHYLH